MVVLSMVLTLLVSACGSPDATAGITTTESPTTIEAVEPQYSIVRDASYLGITGGRIEPLEAYNHPELGEWLYATGPVTGGLIMYRRHTGSSAGEREDLVVMLIGLVGVDALRLTGDTSQVHLGLSCSERAVVLVPHGIPMDSTNHDLDEAIRAWRPGPDGTLVEFDPATGESMHSC